MKLRSVETSNCVYRNAHRNEIKILMRARITSDRELQRFVTFLVEESDEDHAFDCGIGSCPQNL